MDIQNLDQRAVLRSMDVVSLVRDDQWELPTPCSRWTSRQLLQHMAAHNHGFAAAADGETYDASVWNAQPLRGDLRREYAESAQRVITAFNADGVLDRKFWLPEIRKKGMFSARQAISFHFLDYVVHSWDVAAAIGIEIDFDDDIIKAASKVARREVPSDGPARFGPDSSFQPPIPLPDEAPAQDRLLALLGRNPKWPR
ncbi:MAG: TIGR03086 family metal-binding protein [Pseudonocardiaceae bacterium]